jgi:catechol 2,3-dioxygenase-like lactoylglutathione lyase family enzyme
MLQHVTLEVPADRVDECVRFWSVLGFDPIERPPRLKADSVWVERGGTHIHLLRMDPASVPPEGHAAVVVDDFPGTVAAFEEAGYEVRPGTDAWNAPRAFVRDPVGHRVEFMAAPPVPPWPE